MLQKINAYLAGQNFVSTQLVISIIIIILEKKNFGGDIFF